MMDETQPPNSRAPTSPEILAAESRQDDRKPYYLRILIEELEERKKKNARYSLRAFSRFLKMDPAALCRIIAGKQDLSPRACAPLIRKLRLAPSVKRLFLRSVLENRKQKEYQRLYKSVNEAS